MIKVKIIIEPHSIVGNKSLIIEGYGQVGGIVADCLALFMSYDILLEIGLGDSHNQIQ